MMRPMKLAGNELLFGAGALDYIKKIPEKRVFLVIGGSSMKRNGVLDKVTNLFSDNGAAVGLFEGVPSDPSFSVVWKGTEYIKEFKPDLIVGLGGGSVMDAAKTMWVYYEHPELKTLSDLLSAKSFPKLREKSRFMCIPTTSGSASEVSRSIVISDDETGLKHGLGNMEMMPDIAICDPEVALSMPAHITSETGMDALTHSIESLVSNRANYVSDVLATQAACDIVRYLPQAFADGENLDARNHMMIAAMMAGLAFTNVSLGIVHSLAHTIGGFYHISHGLADAIILPYIIRYNSQAPYADQIYKELGKKLGNEDLAELVDGLNEQLGINRTLKEIIPNEQDFNNQKEKMARIAKADGCTKTNPINPDEAGFAELLLDCYYGRAVR
ncbi:MAG: iron-containing alcohol dehydrogenase [Sporolactobacillus sp.]